MSDKTVMKPRPGGRGMAKAAVMPATAEDTGSNDKTRISANVRPADASQRLQVLSVSDNVLIDEAGALFSLVSPIRSTASHADVAGLKTQCIQLINQYEQQLRYKNVSTELIEKARYCMCAFIDETVLNTSWGGTVTGLRKACCLPFTTKPLAVNTFLPCWRPPLIPRASIYCC